jgi:hypothetical protein
VTGRRICAALIAALGAFAVVPAAGAATLTVDDDFKDCPAATFNTIQNAIFAAEPGDTIAICPGEYVEGGGGVGSNGLIIIRDVNIKGAGADLVTIKPRRTRANGGQIAESTNASIRNAIGAIVMINGDDEQYGTNATKPSLLTVNISGVTIDGDGVYADAGVVFRDAQGRITRSRITNVVTTETSYDVPRPGEYKGSNDGYAVASVTAGTNVPLPAAARVVQVDHTRIDKYNAGGILLDGASGDTLPLTASGVITRGILGQNQIVGRTLCIDYIVNGSCQPPGNPVPPLPVATNGPLYGQDGVRITAGSSATITDNTISQNLVQGTGAPNRSGASVNNENLNKAAAVRLIGGAASVFQRNNLTDNSYGVFNVQLDGTTANTAVPVKAENNWWGLRTGALATNPGPAISPTTNPTPPENPVNGTAIPDGTGTTSDAVDFFPFRNGFQSDPNTGEFPVIDVPGPMNDTAPTVTIATDAASYHHGDKVAITAAPSDDFGVHDVTFYDGAWQIGRVTTKPYKLNYTIPSDVTCVTRTLTAVATDSSGQTGSSSTTIDIDANDCSGTPQPTPTPTPTATASPTAVATATATVTIGGEVTATPTPTAEPQVRAASDGPSVAFGNVPASIASAGVLVNVTPIARAGIRQLDVYLGTRKICTLTKAPYTCKVRPRGSDVGRQSLRVVVTDLNGATAESSRNVVVLQFKPKGLSLAASTSGSRTTITGKLQLPSQVSMVEGCKSGSVSLIVRRGSRVIANSQVRLGRYCSFSKRIASSSKAKLTVSARFGGNKVLAAVNANRRFS